MKITPNREAYYPEKTTQNKEKVIQFLNHLFDYYVNKDDKDNKITTSSIKLR